MTERRLRFFLSEHAVEIRTSALDVYEGLRAVWESCARAVVQTRDAHVLDALPSGDRVSIRCDGEVVAVSERAEDTLPILDRTLYEQLARWSVPGRALLHAASLVGRDASLLIAGSSGAGKSSLAWAGILRGYAYAGDEICVSDGRHLWGIPRAVLYDPTLVGRALPPWIEDAEREAYRFTHADDEPCFLPLRRPPARRIATGAWPAHSTHVVLAERATECRLERCEPMAALAALYGERWGDETVALTDLVHKQRCWHLRWSDPDAAFDLLQSAVTGPLHQPVSRRVSTSAMASGSSAMRGKMR